MLNEKQIWNKLNKYLRLKITGNEFKTWFSKIKISGIENDSVTIDAPNKFIASWIKDKYLPEIQSCFYKITNKNIKISFAYGQRNNRKKSVNSKTKNSVNYTEYKINPIKNFESFITGKCNRFAYSSALEVAKGNGNNYNPLYIYCKYGYGKSHLLHAVGNFFLKNNPSSIIHYKSSDEFTREITTSIKYRDTAKVKERYSSLDFLLFDDVHKLDGRKRVQDEFLQIFNTLYEEKKPIVIAGNTPPNKLLKISPQLRSRLGWGLVIEIKKPDNSLKIEFINRKTKEDNISIPEDVIFFLSNCSKDFSILLQNLIRVETYASINNGSLKISSIRSIIRERATENLSVEDIKKISATYFNISIKDIVSNKKKREFSYPRQIAMFLTRELTKLSYKEIGDSFGPKDHSTVIYAIRRINGIKKKQKKVENDLKNIKTLLK